MAEWVYRDTAGSGYYYYLGGVEPFYAILSSNPITKTIDADVMTDGSDGYLATMGGFVTVEDAQTWVEQYLRELCTNTLAALDKTPGKKQVSVVAS